MSVTLSQDDLRAVTTVAISPAYEADRLWLNGEEEDVEWWNAHYDEFLEAFGKP